VKITQEQVDKILDALVVSFDVDVDDGTLRRDYSGRGMYGKRCFGFVVKPGETLKLGAAIVLALQTEDGSLTDAFELLNDARTDDMTWDIIVYFPNATLEVGDGE
jgi:hypothetical protein